MMYTAFRTCPRYMIVYPKRTNITLFSSATSPSITATSLLSNFRVRLRAAFQRPIWRRLALAVRYTRIPLLVASVYSLGYQQGIVDCTKTPVALQNQILNSILMSMGTNLDSVDIIQESMLTPRLLMSSQNAQIAHIGHKIVCAARDYVEEQLEAAMDIVKDSLPSDATTDQTIEYMLANEQVSFWRKARERLKGENVMNQPWQYVLIDSSDPNAFVTEMMPQRFFITSAMLKLATNPNELAMILGHEVSHLVLGHVSESNYIESVLRSVEILLLSVDPTSGVAALAVIGALAAARRILSARHSQRHEYEADELGLQLVARACFDTVQGSHVMRKMNELQLAVEPKIRSKAVEVGQELLSTHPPSLERFERLQQLALQENFNKYRKCQSMGTRLYNTVWSAPSPEEAKRLR